MAATGITRDDSIKSQKFGFIIHSVQDAALKCYVDTSAERDDWIAAITRAASPIRNQNQATPLYFDRRASGLEAIPLAGLKPKVSVVTAEEEKGADDVGGSIDSGPMMRLSEEMDLGNVKMVTALDDEQEEFEQNLMETQTEADTYVGAAERELEELQIRTVHALVERFNIEYKGSDLPKTLLFLTNKQARKFDLSDEEKVRG